jgi:tetratricopeptide (TPR) repeat protein
MTEKEINSSYREICHNLSERRLKPAFNRLSELISQAGLGSITDEFRNLEQNYRFMLQYTMEGIKDPERKKIYRRLILSAFELVDQVYEALKLKYSNSIEYQKKRSFGKYFIENPGVFLTEMEEYYTHKELEALVTETLAGGKKRPGRDLEHKHKLVTLFYHIWFRDRLNSDDAEFIPAVLAVENLFSPYRSLLLSALTLSLIRYFDPRKFSLLFDLYEDDDPEIRQRALIGILINFYRYDYRLPFYPDLTGRLTILNERPDFKKNLEWVILQFIRTKETEKIQQKIRDEIIPEMIRISPNLKNKINLDRLMDDSLSEDKNPEWEEIFKDSPGLLDKMEEFSKLQMEGADVFLGSFSMLKSFPFFHEMANWFIPFFMENPDISSRVDRNDPVNQTFLKTIASAPILCNSDKYSFCFSLNNIPKENREMIVHGMKAEMDQFNELEKEEALSSPGKNEEFISNQVIQDLYRFYKLHPRKSDFEDVFNWRFDFHNTTGLGKILKEDPNALRNIAEFYFAKNNFSEASEIYAYLLTREKSGELYQKIAFCHQKQGNFQLALDNYLKADLYELNKKWNLRKIALCYRNLKNPAKALEYYRQAEILDSENLGIQLSIGHCLLELEQYEEALKCYFRVEYLSPGNRKVWRPIGWCSFLTGKKEQAEKYYTKLLDDSPTQHDLMNMGHVQWSLGNRKAALTCYKRSITEGGFSEDEFLAVFDEDLHHLIRQGIDKEDVPIMLDQLRYFLEE